MKRTSTNYYSSMLIIQFYYFLKLIRKISLSNNISLNQFVYLHYSRFFFFEIIIFRNVTFFENKPLLLEIVAIMLQLKKLAIDLVRSATVMGKSVTEIKLYGDRSNYAHRT